MLRPPQKTLPLCFVTVCAIFCIYCRYKKISALLWKRYSSSTAVFHIPCLGRGTWLGVLVVLLVCYLGDCVPGWLGPLCCAVGALPGVERFWEVQVPIVGSPWSGKHAVGSAAHCLWPPGTPTLDCGSSGIRTCTLRLWALLGESSVCSSGPACLFASPSSFSLFCSVPFLLLFLCFLLLLANLAFTPSPLQHNKFKINNK